MLVRSIMLRDMILPNADLAAASKEAAEALHEEFEAVLQNTCISADGKVLKYYKSIAEVYKCRLITVDEIKNLLADFSVAYIVCDRCSDCLTTRIRKLFPRHAVGYPKVDLAFYVDRGILEIIVRVLIYEPLS